MPKKLLTDKGIKRLKAPAKGQDDWFDRLTPGLALRVSPSGTKTFVQLYRFKGKLRRDTLGRYTTEAAVTDELKWGAGCGLTLEGARRVSAHIADLVRAGMDPHRIRDGVLKAAAQSEAFTYAKAVDEFIEKHAKGKKQNRRRRDQKTTLLRVNKQWNELPVSSITRKQVHAALDSCMAEGKHYEANRRYSALGTFFRWLYSREHVPENIMSGVLKPFDGETESERFWSDDEVAALWNCADEFDDSKKAYLRILILLGHRPMDVGGMLWDDLDLEKAIWNLGFKHKAGWKSGRVAITPLPEKAVEILRELPRVQGNPFVFPGRGTRDREPGAASVGTKRLAEIRRASGIDDFMVKTARATVRTGLEELGFPPHVIDACLNHAPKGTGRKHYGKYTYEKEQRVAFEEWAAHVLKVASKSKPKPVTRKPVVQEGARA